MVTVQSARPTLDIDVAALGRSAELVKGALSAMARRCPMSRLSTPSGAPRTRGRPSRRPAC
jgi:hypothetical protein